MAAYDVAIVGGGPGGYTAAIRAAQLGARTAIVEKDRLGGTCVVRGCIPTKAMLQSSEVFGTIATHGAELGVVADRLSFDYPAAKKRQVQIVDSLVKGVETLMKSNGVDYLRGHGVLGKSGKVTVDGQEITARDIVVATGSRPSTIPIPGVELTIDSDRILELQEAPKRLAVIGGGVVGMEWGALFASLGTEVTVLEALPQILPMVEADLVQLYRRHFEKMGGRIQTSAKVSEVAKVKGGLSVRFDVAGQADGVAADVVLLATGRVPYIEKLGLKNIGVELEKGRVIVDEHLRTNVDGVWAIGDVIGGIMLAHVAMYEGVCAVENIAGGGRPRTPDYHATPNCIYTDPEIANVGFGEAAAREAGYEVNVGRFPLAASGRAKTLGQTEGAVKVVTDAKTGVILGVQMVGPHASDAIAEATLAVQHRHTVQDLDLTMHAHPTMAEPLLQAALAAEGRAIEIPNRRRVVALDPAHPTAVQSTSPVKGEENPSVARRVETRKPQARAEVTNGAAPAIAVKDPEGIKLDKAHRQELLGLYRLMFLIRRFEERAQVEYTRAKIGGYCHLNLGEEATVVGGIVPLKAGDYIYTSYREHGHAIARGVDPKFVMAELFGRETGTSHGRGGSMHIFDYSHRFMGGYGIVGGHLPLATGAGFSIKYKKEKDVVFCMFGDGAVNIGAFHESLNFSKVLKLPIVWFCVNNQYGMGTPVEKASAVSEVYKRACAYDMESIRVDGMDVLEVIRRTHEIVEKTRADSEPRFIEAVNYRFKGHSVVDPDKYRSEEEKEKWRKGDPVVRFEHELEKAKVATGAELREVRNQVEAQVDEVVKFADESPEPPVKELYRFLYAEAGDRA
ncbi:MAG TPA: dihydrolipoyl dehydrogenase [Candidatus Dormibacteraeota bacterium]